MAKLSKRSAVLLKQETTQGTAATLAATDAILVEALTIDVKPEKITRDFARPYLDPVPQMIGKRSVEVKFKTEVKGGGNVDGKSITGYNPLSASLEACGLTGATVGATTVFYPTSSAFSSSYYGPGKSATIQINRDGIQHTVTGALGTFKLTAEAGKPAYFEFSFKGGYAEPTDTAMPATTPNAILPPIVQSANVSLLGYTPIASKIEIDLGVMVTERDDVGSANGILGFQITDINPNGSLDPEVPTVAAQNVFNKLIAGTTGALSATIGNTAGNMINFYCPSVQYADANYQDRNGLLTFNNPINISAITGNDSVRITFL
jgi:hypothetical protein